MLIVGGSRNNRGAILGAIVVWGLWAVSTGLVSAVFPPEQQARAAALQNRADRRVAVRHPPVAATRHIG